MVRITFGSGLDSGKLGRIISWNSPKARAMSREYPFVGGRTPASMGWVAVELTDGTVNTFPKNRIEIAR